MIDPTKINEIIQNVLDNVPPGIKQIPEEMRNVMKSALQSVFEKMDLVTREEFETQRGVLLRTREKVEALEKKLEELQQSLREGG